MDTYAIEDYLHDHKVARYSLIAVSPILTLALSVASVWVMYFGYLAYGELQGMMPAPVRIAPDFLVS